MSSKPSKEVILKMSKPDLENMCFQLKLPTTGTANDLRKQLLAEDFNDFEETDHEKPEVVRKNEGNCTTDGKQSESVGSGYAREPVGTSQAFPGMAFEQSQDPSVSVLLQWMMYQDQQRAEQENRRREEENQRRREEENRRREDETRRWECMLKMIEENRKAEQEKMEENRQADKELLSTLLASHSSYTQSSRPTADYHSVKRLVDRWKGEVKILVDQMYTGIRERRSKAVVQNLAEKLKTYDARLTKILDDNIDYLDSNEETDELVQEIMKLAGDINLVHTTGMEYINDVMEAELAKSREGPLPAGTVIPKFDGNVLNFRQWWEHFESLVHQNKMVAKFWKMRYLLNAMEGTASSILAGKKGLEEEYDEAIDIVYKKFGKDHAIVRQLVNAIVSSTTPTKEAASFGKFVDKVKTNLSALDTHKVSRDMVVMPLIENRLPASTRMDWEREVCSIIDQGRQPSTKDLVKFLEVEHEALCAHSLIKQDKADKQSEGKPDSLKEKVTSAQSLVTMQTPEEERKQRKCFECEGDHLLVDCQSFKQRSKQDRREFVFNKRLCFRCLKVIFTPWHRCRGTECTECHTYHHMLLSCLHKEKPTESQSLSVVTNEGSEVLPTVLARAIHGNNEVIVRLGLDSMSQKTFITSSTVSKLGLKSSGKKTLTVHGFGGIGAREQVDVVELDLVPIDTKRPLISINAYVKEGEVCAPLNAVTVNKADFPHLKNLPLSDPHVPQGGVIDILVGQAPLQQIVSAHIVHPQGEGRQPSAWKTCFGYALMGPIPGNSTECNSLCTSVTTALSLDSRLERFWKLDSLGIMDDERQLSQDEQAAVETFNKETIYADDRYTVPLPFKENAPKLDNNYSRVLRQLKSMEKRLLKNPELKESYQKAMNEYEARGFARELTPDEAQRFDQGEQYFIPHHAVIKELSVSTKCRVVFNASDPDQNGNSLNDCLLPGPSLQPDLGGVLLRFRSHRIALTGDIEKMFMQTAILPKYYQYQQYLWRDCDISAEPRRMVMTRLMFGVSSSPFCAIKSTHQHAESKEQIKICPTICERVSTSLYVDDWQSGADMEDDVIKQYQDAVAFFKSGGWRLTKFASNDQRVLQAISSDDIHPHVTVDLADRQGDVRATPTALGLHWDTQKDCLYVNVPHRLTNMNAVITKRTVLSTMSTVYDVFGFLAPYLITVKILMQVIWRLKVGWDIELQQPIKDAFLKWMAEMDNIKYLPIPRFMFPNRKNKKVSVHGFSDASEKAYGAVIYMCYEDAAGLFETTFVISKTRVAPLKTQTIARLELMAAVILAKLVDYVIKQCTVPGSDLEVEDVHLWSDSEITLAWISKPSTTWKQFVRNRVQQIHQLTETMTWNHCPGKDNPADLLSRGTTLKELEKNDLYWHGPSWLKNSIEWPSKKNLPLDDKKALDSEEVERERSVVTLNMQANEIKPPPEFVLRSSRYLKTKRVYAWVLRFLGYIRGQQKSGQLTSEELMKAETLLLLNLQKRHFEPEINAICEQRKLPQNSPLLGYDPVIDNDSGLLHVGGRLQNSNLPGVVRHPIILPAKDILTKQIVESLHVQGQHAAIETTLSLVRQKYHVVHGREVVRKVVRDCLVCRHQQTKPVNQKMGPVPPHRVIPAPAFSDVGLDFTGVLHIKDGDVVRKGYICVFTCPLSRMIHLELTMDMTTEEFLQALRRFMNRRGWCRSIESDNQTTFKKAKRVLEIAFAGRHWEKMSKAEIDNFMSKHGITWRFITERSPFRGAYWERLNRSLKEPLRKVLGNALLTYTEMYTLLTDIEATLNQRPLTYHGSDPTDPVPITPSQLAIGRNLKEVPTLMGNPSVSISARYKYLQRLLKHFWKRWTTEYLPQLQRKNKWQNEEVPLKVGDVVLVTEDNTTRPTWPMGRVTEVVPGRDGLIRTVKVKTKKGAFVRPVQRLHLLERSDVSEIEENELTPQDGSTDAADESLIVDQGGQDVVEPMSRYGRRQKLVDRFGIS